MKTTIYLVATLIVSSLLFSFTGYQKKPWDAPDKYVKMTNPIKPDAESIKAGKALWTKHCQSCHGKTGLGDGTKAAQLDTEVGDLTATDAQKQSDGSLFYKISEGRDEMPTFKKKIPDEDEIWQVVNYVRSLKAK